MFKSFARWFILFSLIFSTSLALAQTAPQQIAAALNDLSGRVGRSINITDLDAWSFNQAVYPDTSLGCPQPGVAYAQVTTSGFQFLITYAGTQYDYRVSADQTIVVLCNAGVIVGTPAPACPPPNETGYLVPRLSIGAQGRVEDGGLPNLLRDLPGSSGGLLGQLEPGTEFIVVDGPRCSLLDKIVWWQVTANGLTGWTAEGRDGDYWIEPLGPSVGIEPVQSAVITLSNANTVTQLFTPPGINLLGPDENTLIVGEASGIISLFDFRTIATRAQVQAHTGAVSSLALGRNLQTRAIYVVSGGSDALGKVWALDTTANTFTVLAQLTGHSGPINAISINSTTELIVTGSADNTVRVWRLLDGAPLANLAGHTAAVVSVEFGTGGILSRDETGRTIIWGLATSGGAAG